MTTDIVIDRLDDVSEPEGGAGREVLLLWGDTAFAVPGHERLRRSSRFRWPSIDRLGARANLQYTGPGADTIRIDGTRIAELDAVDGLIVSLRGAAGEGVARPLVAGDGTEYGLYALTSIEEAHSGLYGDGTPRKTAYSLEFQRAPDAPGGRLDGLEDTVRHGGNPRAVLDAGQRAAAGGAGPQATLDAMSDAAGALNGSPSAPDTARMLQAARKTALKDARASSAQSVAAALDAARTSAARAPAEKDPRSLGEAARVAYRAKAGDVLDDICWRHYGTLDVLGSLTRANPGLARLGASLPAGVLVQLPDPGALTSKARDALVRLWD